MKLDNAMSSIQSVIESHDGTISTSDLIATLEREGLRSEEISAALAYAVQQGKLELDWEFRLRRSRVLA